MNSKFEAITDPLKTDFEKLKMYVEIQKVLELKKIFAIISNPNKVRYSSDEIDALYNAAFEDFLNHMPSVER